MPRPFDPETPIFVSGHRGLVGSALVRSLERRGHRRIVTADRRELDLRDQAAVDRWFAAERPELVLHVAGRVGGIAPNSARPADFLYDNLMIHATVLRAAAEQQVAKLLYVGSSCIYPRDCPQPMRESSLLNGPLEPTNEAYAIAKISGIMACRAYRRQHGCNFIAAIPTNLYGPNDNFDLEDAHVLPALMRKFHEARRAGRREVEVWGSGRPRRELMHVDDLAEACLFLLAEYDEESPINVGTGVDVTILELAEMIGREVHPDAEIVFDASRPDGMPRKLLDVSRIDALGWRHRIELADGIEKTYAWFAENEQRIGCGIAG